jgi:Outer membrane protein beta-barrel domain
MIELMIKIVSLSFLLLISANFINAQNADEDKLKKYEIEAHFTYVRLRDFNIANVFDEKILGLKVSPLLKPSYNEPGIGVRLSYNINKYVAVEIEGNMLPNHRDLRIRENFYEKGGLKLQAFGGTKIGKRVKIGNKQFGFFAKVRPGITRFDTFHRIDEYIPITNGFILSISQRQEGFFTLDVGGVVEYNTSKRTFIRTDFGDTIIHYGKAHEEGIKSLNPTFTRHNFQTSIGFGFRF